MDTFTLSSSVSSSNKISAMVNTLSNACDQLVDVFAMTFDKVSDYGIQSLQGVFRGVKSLFVDVILVGLKKIELIIQELKTNGSDLGCSADHIQHLLELQRQQLYDRLGKHAFFRENFGWKIDQMFLSS